MPKITRELIRIDEEKCDGCGNCVPSCAEGALQIIDGKARLVKESYCDGLGACLGECPQGALTVVVVDADSYDELAVLQHLRQTDPERAAHHEAHMKAHAPAAGRPGPEAVASCPSVKIHMFDSPVASPTGPASPQRSELRQWPVQLTLLPVEAPFLLRSPLTLVADCVPFAYPDMHAEFMRGSAIAVGCPKLDDAGAYIKKLAQILQRSQTPSLRVAYMEVPCCRGLVYIAEQAIALSGTQIPLETVLVRINS